MSATRTELRALTGVRGIAAWAVVLYHIRLSLDWAPRGAIDVLAKGYLAVDFFFLLSGFVIWMTWGSRLRESGWRDVPLFLQKRIARIWPLHVVILSGGIALALALAATGRHNPVTFPFAELPLHALLIQNWGTVRMLAWNVPAWSISTELFAYLLFPLLAMRIDLSRCSTAVLIALIATILVGLSLFMAAFGVSDLGKFIPQLGLMRCIAEFFCGTAVGALWLRWRHSPAWPAVIAGVSSVGLGVLAIGHMLPETFVVPAAFSAALLALALTSGMRGNPLDLAPLHYLGEISYATYLGHFLLWTAFKLAFVDDPHAVPPILVALYLAMILASSIALYHLVERPAQQAVNAVKLPSRLREALAKNGRSPSPGTRLS